MADNSGNIKEQVANGSTGVPHAVAGDCRQTVDPKPNKEKTNDNNQDSDSKEHVENDVCISTKEQVDKNDSKEKEDVDLTLKIIRQVEFYFGDLSLPNDKFLKDAMKEDDGWISIDTMMNFRRLANITKDQAAILSAVKKSDSGLMEVDESQRKIRRNPSLAIPEWNEERKKQLQDQTVYLKGFDKEKTTMDELLDFFGNFEGFAQVIMRTYKDRKDNQAHFKGSIFVRFKDKESAEKFLVRTEPLKYKDVELILKRQVEYFKEKEQEVAEKKQRQDMKRKNKMAKKIIAGDGVTTNDGAKAEKENATDINDLPLGTILTMEGFDNNSEIKREDIKENLATEFGVNCDDIAFVYYNKGETSAKLRFKEANAAVALLKKIKDTLNDSQKWDIMGSKVEVSVLEGDCEKEFLVQCKEDINTRVKKRHGHKRRGGFQGGRGGKRQKF